MNHQKSVLRKYRTGKIDPVTKIFWSLNKDIILRLAFSSTLKVDAILDVGCGAGGYLIELAKVKRECYGIDPLEILSLKKARERAAEENVVIHLCKAVGEKLPFRKDVFNMVLCISTIQHVGDQREVLDEANRVLRNDGLLLTQVPNHKHIGTLLKTPKIPSHFTRAFHMREMKNALVRANFDILEIKGCGFFPPLTPRFLKVCYCLFGNEVTKKLIELLDVFAFLFSSYAASIIILCKKSSKEHKTTLIYHHRKRIEGART